MTWLFIVKKVRSEASSYLSGEGGGGIRKGKFPKGRYITRYTLDRSSYNPNSQKVTTIRTLLRQAQLVCDSQDRI